MKRIRWSTEMLQQAANEYTNRTEFARGNRAAYSVAARRKILDDICGHMIAKQAPRYTDDQLRQSAAQFQHRSDWRAAEPSMYQAAHSRGIVDDLCAHMTLKPLPGRKPGANKWTDEALRAAAAPYTDRAAFRREQPQAADSATRKGVYDQITAHMNRGATTKLTHDEYVASVPSGITVVGQYVTALTKIEHRCNECGHEWSVQPATIRSGKGCPVCAWETAKIKLSECRRYTSEQYAALVPHLTVLGEYRGVHTHILHRCNTCSHEWMLRPAIALLKYGCPGCTDHGSSKGEREIADYVTKLGYTIEQNTRLIIPPKEIDIFVSERNLAIEFNGSYWHSLHPQNYHLDKTNACERKNIRLIHVWEHELRNPIMRSIIATALGHADYVFHARKCTIEQLDWGDTRLFLAENHIQGPGAPTPINLGLCHDGELVAVMTFAKPRFQPIRQNWELVRYAVARHTRIVGGANRLWSRRPTGSIITYSDRRLFDGSLYRRLGFKRDNDGAPGYFYVNASGDTLLRFQTQRKKLATLLGDAFDPDLSESENMKRAGWLKIWDCGAVRWVWD